jgi:hypothetical protein
MHRRDFLRYSQLCLLPALHGCGLLRIDPWHFLIRSPHITSVEQEKEIVSRAQLEWSKDQRIRVLYVKGNAYERGYQHGVLLRDGVADNLGYIYKQALRKFHFEELFSEVYERMRPYIPQDYIDEMHGLAHGARVPLKLVHAIHILPSIGEWGGRRNISKVIKKMIRGDLGTSCSNVAVGKEATLDGSIYAVRILDWGMHRISKLHQYPLITIGVPDDGIPYCNIGWVGFLGAVSGMNAEGITLGEMGYGDPPNEKLEGVPMPFMLRDVLDKAKNLADVRRIIQESPPTSSFGFLMTDGKTSEAELYVRDPDRFRVFGPNQDLYDERQDKRGNIKKEFFPARSGTVYGGHFEDKMAEQTKIYNGQFTPELLMEKVIPAMVMKSNFQNVVYDPKRLRFWVNNAKSRKISAQHQPYTFFDFGLALAKFQGELS